MRVRVVRCIVLIYLAIVMSLSCSIKALARMPEAVGVDAPEDVTSPFSGGDLTVLAKTLYGEADSVKSQAEKAMVVWCVLNRYDNGNFGKTITEICTAPSQFAGYKVGHPVTDENLELVKDVINRWVDEKNGKENIGRTLPKKYLFFCADSNPSKGEWHNKFYHYDANNKRIYYDYRNPISDPY